MNLWTVSSASGASTRSSRRARPNRRTPTRTWRCGTTGQTRSACPTTRSRRFGTAASSRSTFTKSRASPWTTWRRQKTKMKIKYLLMNWRCGHREHKWWHLRAEKPVFVVVHVFRCVSLLLIHFLVWVARCFQTKNFILNSVLPKTIAKFWRMFNVQFTKFNADKSACFHYRFIFKISKTRNLSTTYKTYSWKWMKLSNRCQRPS